MEKPLTLVQIKKALQPSISKHARKIDRNRQIDEFNRGIISYLPKSRGLCNWLAVKTDANRHVLIFTVWREDYFQEVVNMARQLEEIIKKEFDQIVPIEVKMPPLPPVFVDVKSIGVNRGESSLSADDDDCPF